ncbi:MAG: hypothetical protein PWQ99_1090 [Clostridia bacterium]|jgi:hypothetical protein|uniref:Uncharacterized protein n=1 Tax=Thermacetogenium phaeum TaxID=85874 RepID=A0A101FGZ3_9THEO|nr:MAG: Uncharacterized protein XD66_0417 [Thermacetogenium phaeum]MDK2881315.1 hypothetical protein [Clostridia bacterium]MDN5375716.1 hypothetical protein [Thermacetogenium sp.]
MAVHLRLPKKNIHLKIGGSRAERQNDKKKQSAKHSVEKVTATDTDANSKKVKLEFPYDDLELLYQYTLKEMGIKDPFE